MQINRERLLDTFQRLVSIDSPTFGEREMADTLKEEMEVLGFTVTEDRAGEIYGGTAGNLYAFRKGTLPGKPLLFSTHMDTVEPSRGKRAVIQDGRITSDGTTVLGADCMSGTTAILEALQAISEKGCPCRDLEVIFFVAEEKHLRGSEVFDFSQVKAEESYILDLSGPVGTAACQAPTLVDFQIDVYGRAAHAGFAPERGVHAIQAAARAVARMELGHVGDEMTVNIGAIQGGGITTNIVPEHCQMIGEVRSYVHKQALREIEKIERIFREEAENVGGSCKVTYTIPLHAYCIPEGHSCIQRFQRACRVLGLPGTLTRTFGGSDQSNLTLHGVPGLVLASAMEQVHSCGEYMVISELERLTELVGLLMQTD
ncbi:MAG: M20/M25/M40 family metallo-hydrolase [Lachnospiraceae bacterium]|nr:M20/M25/M40 family metallo-hydrolase [Lachnospiraceae bacterium]